MNSKKQKPATLLRRILTPVIATGLMLVFWLQFKNDIPFWWVALAIIIFLGNYAYSFYQKKGSGSEIPDDEKWDLGNDG